MYKLQYNKSKCIVFWRGVCISKIFITKICILLYGLNIFNIKPLKFIKNLMNNN